MRLVVDTNVFVSLLIRPGQAFASFTAYLDQHGTILYSTGTMTELVEVLRRKKFSKYTTSEQVSALVEWIFLTGELVMIHEPVAGSRDPKDDKFLALALSGQDDYLISGDQDLLVLNKIGSIPIISPAAFLAAVNF